MNVKDTAPTLLVAILATAYPAAAQMQQVPVKVDDKDYTVTEMMARPGRGHMVQLSGPEGTAMVMVDTSNKITAYLSPPGGGGLQDLINKVWAAYLDKKGVTAPAPAVAPAADPNAELRARAAAVTSQVQNRVAGTSSPAANEDRTVKQITDSTITVYDPSLKADVTFTKNLMEATWSITPAVPAGMPVSPKTEKYNAHFEGGDKSSSALGQSGAMLKGVAVGVGNAADHSASASSTIASDPDKVWALDETTGSTKILLYESGGMRVGGNIAYSGRDPKGDLGRHALVALKQDLDFAEAAIQSAQQNGQATGFDLKADRFERGTKALDAAVQSLQ